jgi:hypothetical protein
VYFSKTVSSHFLSELDIFRQRLQKIREAFDEVVFEMLRSSSLPSYPARCQNFILKINAH